MISSATPASQETILATRIKPTAKDLYEADLYVWAQDQAELLRNKRFDKLDLANLIEEVEDLASDGSVGHVAGRSTLGICSGS